MIRLTPGLTALMLAAISAIGPLATALYTPAFPTMARVFGVGADQIQLTLTAYMAGLAISQLLYGPLADRFGRRPMLLGGLGLFTLGSIACMLAESIPVLLVFRFLQAFGAASGMVLGRAVVRDTFSNVEATRVLALMGSILAVAPALGPIIGGVLLQFGWQAIFAALVLYGLLALVFVAMALPESLKPEQRQSLSPGMILGNYLSALRNRVFMGHVLAVSSMFAGHFAFVSSASFVLIDAYGVPATRFGLYYLVVIGAFILGNLISARVSGRVSIHSLIVTGAGLSILGGSLMSLLVFGGAEHPLQVVAPQLITGFGAGLLVAPCIAGALMPFPHMAGTASALLGFLQMGAAALSTALLGYLYDGTARPMALAIALCGVGTLTAYLLLVGRAGQPGAENEPLKSSG
ncbi:multidrug effflux MFS transporter [Stutzerimonas tarimensis]|uniref:Bcr/CflA family efflux transporter n=1 Tax=Stutzerimonas tarimensis TaxID=1507735 RepID=A0ABV7T4K3_9GAMM